MQIYYPEHDQDPDRELREKDKIDYEIFHALSCEELFYCSIEGKRRGGKINDM